ncbi:MAG: ATP synthase subunit I [Actinobacteria bacterium]|nr:MAG: ATP synthase subunit I [Actinomycetota bacterium]
MTETPNVEHELARDMILRALPVLPLVVLVAWATRGGNGALSAGFGIGLVLANLTLSAVLLAWAARVSPSVLMATALGGFLVRMTLVGFALYLVKDLGWADLPVLAVTVLVTHLGMLFWETRYVSASLAFPALKPQRKGA